MQQRPSRSSGKSASQIAYWIRDRNNPIFASRYGFLWVLISVYLIVTTSTRLGFLVSHRSEISWGAPVALAWPLGFLFDLGAGILWLAPFAIVLAALPRRLFTGRFFWVLGYAVLFLTVYAIIFGAVAEWLFWDEFGVRFNFIAVDYLVYTTEVIGNIRESYSLPVVGSAVYAASLLVSWLLIRLEIVERCQIGEQNRRSSPWLPAVGWVAGGLTFGFVLNERIIPESWNSYNRELAKNGLWSLFAAFRANELEFERFYPTLPIETAFERVHRAVSAKDQRIGSDPHDLLRTVSSPGPERRLNVIQITVESLSASFMQRYGDRRGLTPNLDELARRSLVFDQFFATGTRTDRGMEALTLSVPPTPGRSLIKRPRNSGLFTLGSVFRSKGYETAFIYGGFGYFDNMNAFFGGNGYRVVDRASVAAEDITFSNVWGACDEDLYRWALREADSDYEKGKPFFHFVMTTSNHRPYTFPEGRIDMPSKISGRAGAVKYTDYAIGAFLREASKKPWFNETLFVVVGDHCASSAGKTTLPMQNYQVPLMMFTPGGQIAPRALAAATSQIDYGPTLLGRLGWTYLSRFFGRDVLQALADSDEGPLFVGTYQKLGMYRKGALAVLAPLRQPEVYDYDRSTYEMTNCRFGSELAEDAVATYQVASWLFRNEKQGEIPSVKRANDLSP